jgi:hypothetical protein
MSAGDRNDSGAKRRWAFAAAAGVGAAVISALLFRAPGAAPRPSSGSKPVIGIGEPAVSAVTRQSVEDAALTDPTPLFLPTEWNSSEKPSEPQAPQGSFSSYGPNYAFGDSGPDLGLPATVSVPAAPSDELQADPPGPPYVGLGETGADIGALPKRGAFVDVVATGTGRRVFGAALKGLPAGIADLSPEGGAWVFMAAVDSAGLVEPLVPLVRSGRAVDAYLAQYLSRDLRVGDRLPPGFYRVSVGP